MDWSTYVTPPLRREARFGDRVVPLFTERPASIWAMVEQAAARNGDGEALVCGTVRLSWREVVETAARIAGGLHARGLRPGDRLAVLLGNRIEFVLTLFAAAKLGLITVLLSTRQQTPEIAYVLKDCGATLLLHEAALADRLPAAAETPELAGRIAVDDHPPRSGFAVLADHAAHEARVEVAEEDTAMILYTSGTTGRPKGAMLAHGNIVHSSMIYEACLGLTPADRSIAAVPLGHVTGVVANVTSMARCAGTLIIMPEFKAGEYLKLAARERVTYTVMVPAMYNLCLLQRDFDSHDLSSWRIGGFGGVAGLTDYLEANEVDLLIDATHPFANRISANAAEAAKISGTPVFALTRPGWVRQAYDRWISVGSVEAAVIALGETPRRVFLVMDGEGRELPRGEIGEIWIGGGQVIKGYWNNPMATAESFTAGYWHSGDLGSVDADNFVRVFDRQKDMINRGGLKIYSAEVESVLASHPLVVESAIIARPCPVLGERVHAVVVTRGPAQLVR